jgi:sialate O-acetylesterase
VNGILSYQGESNAQEMERVNEYAALSKLMIDDYRKQWRQKSLPFYFVQLSSIDTAKYKSHFWPKFRDEQRKMLQLIPNCGMAVCSDIGARDDVHPTNKKDVGERLARWALNKTYSQHIIPSGPLPVKAIYSKGKLVVSFQYTGNGLKTSDGKPLRSFSVDGRNDIDAIIDDFGIIIAVSSKPEYIYYGWKPFSDANLVNSENLPASTFKIKVQ